MKKLFSRNSAVSMVRACLLVMLHWITLYVIGLFCSSLCAVIGLPLVAPFLFTFVVLSLYLSGYVTTTISAIGNGFAKWYGSFLPSVNPGASAA